MGNTYRLGHKHTDEAKAKMSAAKMGENNPAKRPEVRAKMMGNTNTLGYNPTDETRAKLSAAGMGNKRAWIDGRSYDPYCPAFNEAFKEIVRNRWGRNCMNPFCKTNLEFQTGSEDFGISEIWNSANIFTTKLMYRLSAHHVDGDKAQGCDGIDLFCVPVCTSCNSKKFHGLKLEEHPGMVLYFWFKEQERKHREEMLGYKFGTAV